jgi:hypothetical protein
VSHCDLAIYIKNKNYGNSNISPCTNIIFKKKSSKRNQNPSRYHNSNTNLKFQHKPKYHLSKILIQKIDLLLLPRGKNILYNESKHDIVALVGKPANKVL